MEKLYDMNCLYINKNFEFNKTNNLSNFINSFECRDDNILLIDILISICNYLNKLLFNQEIRLNFLNIELTLLEFLLDVSVILIPNLIFVIYAMYSPFINFSTFDKIEQVNVHGMKFPLIDPFWVYNYLYQYQNKHFAYYNENNEGFPTFENIFKSNSLRDPQLAINYFTNCRKIVLNCKNNSELYDKYENNLYGELNKPKLYDSTNIMNVLGFLNTKGNFITKTTLNFTLTFSFKTYNSANFKYPH